MLEVESVDPDEALRREADELRLSPDELRQLAEIILNMMMTDLRIERERLGR